MRPRRVIAATLLIASLLPVGCGEQRVAFRNDGLLRATNELTAAQSASIDRALADLFGTPDEPRLPTQLPELASLLDNEVLLQAAGPVISHTPGVTQGLYRRHCARCHGVTGDGRGPMALYQSPYPRDFRRGVFKWKSTHRGAKPTRADLLGVLERGVPGTAMPSFALLSEPERETLVQYAIYLAIRGEAERSLVDYLAGELPLGAELSAESLRADSPLVTEWLGPIVGSWIAAGESIVAAPTDSPSGMAAAERIDSGRELYHSERTGCYKCHGEEGQGGVVAGRDYTDEYDVWTSDRHAASDRLPDLVGEDLPVRAAKPARLVDMTPRGGSTLADLYRRIHQGVAGTPMPAVGPIEPSGSAPLSDDEITMLAEYVATLIAIEKPKPSPSEVTAR